MMSGAPTGLNEVLQRTFAFPKRHFLSATDLNEIEVANLWVNRLIGDAALPPEKRLTKTNVTLQQGQRTVKVYQGFGSEDPLLPSGPDPWIVREGGAYYYLSTRGDRIAITCSSRCTCSPPCSTSPAAAPGPCWPRPGSTCPCCASAWARRWRNCPR